MKMFKKYKKTFALLIILVMFVQMLTPAGGMFASAEEGISITAIDENLVTEFSMSITEDGKKITIENNEEYIVDLEKVNNIGIDYKLSVPNYLEISGGDTYTIDLPEFFSGSASDIKLDDIATYSIIGGQLIITFNEDFQRKDDIELNINFNGNIDREVFEKEEKVDVIVPFRDGTSFKATIRPKANQYDAQDKKTAGFQYVLDGDEKQKVDRNPEYIDWTILANDSMGSIADAKIVDTLGENLEIEEGSIKVHRIIRNYKNEEIDREEVDLTKEMINYSGNGFELNLGAIENAYEVSYTTKIIRPEGGGTLTIKNNAKIILDETENSVADDFDGTWSGDLPTISKEGNKTDDPHVLNWEIKYNFGKENLGNVNLIDNLTHGQVDLDTVKVYTVDVDIDGKIIEDSKVIVEASPKIGDEGNLTIPNLNADGKAYYITYSSSVPVGLKDVEIKNTISDDLDKPNIADDLVTVNTVPTGGKVGEQSVDENGNPYIEWTITMNKNKVDVANITVRDVFNPKDIIYLDFNVTNTDLFTLYKDDDKAENFKIKTYVHEDGRTGFQLDISDAGPHTYKFVYKTYYTVEGMKQPQLANNAELVFLDGAGGSIGEPGPGLDFSLKGPKAGIEKKGKYVLNDDGIQEIEWSVTFNRSNILLNTDTKITENFASKNYEYLVGSLTLKDGEKELEVGTDYALYINTDTDKPGFVIGLLKDTNKKLTLTFRTTVDDTNNLDHKNEVTLDWQGGEETTDITVAKRDAGITKSGEVVINEDGSKTVNWTIKFNTKKNVIHDFKLTDTYTPASVTVSNIKIKSGDADVTEYFTISDERTGGEFTVTKDQLKAQEYTLTYSTTLSPEEEKAKVKNTADIKYTGGSDEIIRTVSSPELKVAKQADKIIKPSKDNINPLIEWTIYANTDSKNKFVNLVDAILEDTIPLDQKLVSGSVKAVRTDDTTIKIDGTKIAESAEGNSFRIELPNGPYQYTITYKTKILEMPSFDGEHFDKYNNTVTLSNQTKNQDLKQDDKADAWIHYYGKLDNDLTGKTGSQNNDTENIDYVVTINPDGLTIHNAKITDTLSDNHEYIKDSIKLFDTEGNEISEGFTLVVAENKSSFTVTFDSGSNSTGTIDSKYLIKYSTRLKDNLIGNYTVKNDIVLTGGTKDTELSETKTSTTAQQWFYGGGGSGRTVKLEVKKLDNKAENPTAIEGAVFKLERANLNSSLTVVDAEIETNENGIFIKDAIRAGRYILTEKSAPGLYQKLDNPVHFLIGYTNPADYIMEGEEITNPYTITIVDANWNTKEHSHASAEGNVLTIVNEFKPATYQLRAKKTLEGTKLVANEFEFKLLDSNDQEISQANNDVEGNVIFDKLTFTQPGKYTYKMVEVKGDRLGMTYDNNTREVSLTIVEGDSGLKVSSVNYDNSDKETGNIFENNYKPLSTDLALKANKELIGRDIVAEEFTFEVYATDSDNEITGEVIKSAINDADGLVEFESITYTEVGIYNYVMVEVFGDKDTVTYDDRKIYFTVTVSDEEGQLKAVLDIDKFEFSNIYTPHPADLELEVIKKLMASNHPLVGGRELLAGEFKFELLDAENKHVTTSTNNADGSVKFVKEDYFKEVGEYKFTIKEVKGTDSTINYATDEIGVTVNVEDNEGQLEASIEYDIVNPTFENIEKTYAIGDYTWIDANNNGIQDDDEVILPGVIVELYDAEGKKIDETTTDSNGLYIFDELVAGTYKVRFVLTAAQATQYRFTQEVAGDDSINNSDAHPISGWTKDIVLNDENKHLTKAYTNQEVLATQGIDPTWDAGVILRTRTNISVEKVWSGGPVDKNSVFIQLYRNGVELGELIELNDSNDWTYTWTNLYRTDKQNQAYVYTVMEVDMENYSVEITGDAQDGFVVTNTFVSPPVDITAVKIWVGGPELKPTIQLQLYRNGQALEDGLVFLENGQTSYTWFGLDRFDQQGKEYIYTVDELDVPESYDKSISDDGLTITNTHEALLGGYEPDKPNRPPNTSVDQNILYYRLVLISSIGLLLLLKKRSYKKI